MNYDPTAPRLLFIDKETREHWARYLIFIEGMDEEMDGS